MSGHTKEVSEKEDLGSEKNPGTPAILAKLQYDLTDPQARSEFKRALFGGEAHEVIWNLDQWLRGEMKYKDLTPDKDAAFDEVRTKLRELCSDCNVDVEGSYGEAL